MTKKLLVWFNEVDKDDVGLVGGKGANLGEMTKAGFPVPFGFIITSHAYFDFIEKAGIQPKIKQFLRNLNPEHSEELRQASKNIKDLILKSPFPKDLALKIIEFYNELPLMEKNILKKRLSSTKRVLHKVKSLYRHPLVAVRSSATAEDLPDASFAGQQETFLNVRGDQNLIRKVKECFASLFTERAIYYRHNQGYSDLKVGLATVIQRMVQSDKSGIAFSIDPVTNDRNKIVIEAVYGLGEYIVQGKITPDHYEIDKRSFVMLQKEVVHQSIKYIKSGSENKEMKLGKREGSTQKLNDEEITKLALLITDIEKHYYFPQDIEWAQEKDRMFIVQSRPITTIKETGKKGEEKVKVEEVTKEQPILTGSPASPGIGVGHVCIVKSPAEIGKIREGEILVAEQTNPDYVPAMKKATAIVTQKGGRTSHAAIVSRELGIPAVVGAENALKILRDGMAISVNGATGEVFRGTVKYKPNGNGTSPHAPKSNLKTLTKVYVNLAEPDQAKTISEENVDGVGLLRAEFMIADIGTHPQEFIKNKKENEFVELLTKDILKFVKAFDPRPIIYRATDFKTNEYRHLKGGEKYEHHEENPMLGFRGASRYISNPAVFKLELEAIKRVWSEGHSNLHLMIPFVRAPWELIKIKEIIKEQGLLDVPKFKLYMMVEVPAAAISLEEFLKIGIDGVSIGSNDLTMMILGVDRDNADIANIYDERSPAVVAALENIVATCVKYGVTSSICGQAASDYPELVERLIDLGITSVSVNPDAIDRTRQLIYDIEKGKHKKMIEKNDKLKEIQKKLLEISN